MNENDALEREMELIEHEAKFVECVDDTRE